VSEISVLLVEDDSMVRGWVRLALEASEFRLAGEAATGAEAVDLAERRRPDVLLVDYRLGDSIGTEVLRDLRRRGDNTPAVLMTANLERGFNELAREAGAKGTVLKSGRAEELLQALRAVSDGGESFDGRHPPRQAGQAALSPREREVMRLLAGGATNKEIAAGLQIGEETVKTLVARTFAKLGVKRRAEAVSVAHELGLL
jgi:DNA-binding NarL/FixJ family response regulator